MSRHTSVGRADTVAFFTALLAGQEINGRAPGVVAEAKKALRCLRRGQFWGDFYFANGRLARHRRELREVTALFRGAVGLLARCPRFGCRKLFVRNGRRQFCSERCAAATRSKRRRQQEGPQPADWKTCTYPMCGRSFPATKAVRVHCSPACGSRHRAFRQRQRQRVQRRARRVDTPPVLRSGLQAG
jgi:hypothetical protein